MPSVFSHTCVGLKKIFYDLIYFHHTAKYKEAKGPKPHPRNHEFHNLGGGLCVHHNHAFSFNQINLGVKRMLFKKFKTVLLYGQSSPNLESEP